MSHRKIDEQQAMRRILSFRIDTHDHGRHSIMPCVDAVPFAELIESYEMENGFEPVGGYGGLIPESFDYGRLDQYFLGQTREPSFWTDIGGVYLLGCQCGEVGCWPLECRIELTEQEVIWREFRQPHRPLRDYSRFGPLLFSRANYERTLLQLVSGLTES
jgi:hypothetical protein